MMEVAEKNPKSLILTIADMIRSNPPICSSFVAEFARRLHGQSAALALPLTWIEQQLSESNLTIDKLVQSENQQQAADQVSLSNSIGSIRFLATMDWREFVKTMSVVEQTQREDPGGAYDRMDFASRDRYRHAVERIAKKSSLPEEEVARNAIQVEALEVRFLANPDQNLHFGLLTDFLDAPEETTPEDEPLLQCALKRIGELNEKYRSEKVASFFLFHRPRRWNPRERIWMGYERKRGKLADLNSLLRGGSGDHFSTELGETSVL